MSKLRVLVFFAMVAALAGSAFAADTPFLQMGGTTDQVALFSPFVVNVPSGPGFDGIRSAVTISNIMSAPAGLELDSEFATTDIGTIDFYLFRADGQMFHVNSADLIDPDDVGNGALNEDGELAAGMTWNFFMDELFEAGGGANEIFTGYMWVVCNFDAAAGTTTTFNAALGLAQSFKMDPAVATGFFYGGIPVEVQ